ncbi:MAG: TonB-dependent receptor plug domain-containing protein [Terriglobales bacterium]
MAALLVWALEPFVAAQQKPNLAELDIEDLMKIEVTSAAKKEQKLQMIPAAVFVITPEEIRRSGATSVGEVLRLVPGVEVAWVNSETWAISIRGFNSWYSNKLLVMVDGRSVYLPTFSGVSWWSQDLVLEDIERIEVIRGPGASLWGSNAVNGVINIITKSSADTQGGMFSAGGGNEDRGSGVGRYGSRVGSKGTYRLFAKYIDRGSYVDATGADMHNGWSLSHGGFRSDWAVSDRDALTISGDIYTGNGTPVLGVVIPQPPFQQDFNMPRNLNGGNVLLRWQRTSAEGSRASVQAYYDRAHEFSPVYGMTQHTFDLDAQYQWRMGRRHEFVSGFDFRVLAQRSQNSVTLAVQPPAQTFRLFSGFLQDEIAIIPNHLKLTLGSKFESNNFNGFAAQPTVRLLWMLKPQHTVWAAVSRAVRTPSLSDRGTEVPVAVYLGPIPIMLTLVGNTGFRSEDLLAYEAGYRAQPTTSATIDVAAFYYIYHHVQGAGPLGLPWLETEPQPVRVIVPISMNNLIDAKNYGVEVFTSYAPVHGWKLHAGYTWLKSSNHVDPANAATAMMAPGENPVHQVQFRSLLSLPHAVEFDNFLYYVSRLPAQSVPAYVRWDVRFGWHPRSNLELSVGGQNLLSGRHTEFSPWIPLFSNGQVSRSSYGKLTWRF